jgi:hypothetical protein
MAYSSGSRAPESMPTVVASLSVGTAFFYRYVRNPNVRVGECFFLRDFPTVSYRFSRMGTVRTDIAGKKLCLRCRKHCNLLASKGREIRKHQIHLTASPRNTTNFIRPIRRLRTFHESIMPQRLRPTYVTKGMSVLRPESRRLNPSDDLALVENAP